MFFLSDFIPGSAAGEPGLHLVPPVAETWRAARVMESLLPILTAFAATDAPAERPKRSSGLSDFPTEEPSEKELDEWLNENGPHVRQTHGAILRGETPPNLVHYDYQDDLTGFTEIAAPSGEDASAAAKRQAHNLKVRQMQQANATRRATLQAGMLEAAL